MKRENREKERAVVLYATWNIQSGNGENMRVRKKWLEKNLRGQDQLISECCFPFRVAVKANADFVRDGIAAACHRLVVLIDATPLLCNSKVHRASQQLHVELSFPGNVDDDVKRRAQKRQRTFVGWFFISYFRSPVPIVQCIIYYMGAYIYVHNTHISIARTATSIEFSLLLK